MPFNPGVTMPLAKEITVEAMGATPIAPPMDRQQPESQLESRLESSLAARIFALLSQQESGKAALAQVPGHRTVSGE